MASATRKMEEYANEIHFIAMRIVKITTILNFLNILYDVIIFAEPQWQNSLPDWIGFLQTIISIAGSILFGISTTIAALYGSKTVGISLTLDSNGGSPDSRRWQGIVVNEPVFQQSANSVNFQGASGRAPSFDDTVSPVPCCQRSLCSIMHQLYLRWEQTKPKEKALRVNQVMETVVLPHVSPLYDSVYSFRETVRSHMLSRMGLSGILNLMTTIFFYYNALIYTILYSGSTILKLEPRSERLLYLMLNVINPIVCLAISYVVILCDNFNSLVIYAREVSSLLNVVDDDLEKTKQTIKSFVEKIERPLVRQLWAED